MTESELSMLVTMAQQARRRQGGATFIDCRGEMEGQRGVIVYSFSEASGAAAFLRKRQIEAHPVRLEILDRRPTEVRECLE